MGKIMDLVKFLIDYESPEEIEEREGKTREESYKRCLKNISTDGKTVDAEKLSVFLVDGLWGDSKRYNS